MKQLAFPAVAAFFSIALLTASPTPASATPVLSPVGHIQTGIVADSAKAVHYRKRRYRRHNGYYGFPFIGFQFGNYYDRPYRRHYKRRYYNRGYYGRRHGYGRRYGRPYHRYDSEHYRQYRERRGSQR